MESWHLSIGDEDYLETKIMEDGNKDPMEVKFECVG